LSAGTCYERAGYRTSGHASDVNASKLLRRTDIMQRLNEMAQVPVRKAQVSIENLLAQLDEVIRESRADRNHSATIAGYNLVVKIAAMLRERHEHDEFGGLKTSDEIEHDDARRVR
jgi:hypothetical protein